MERGVSGRRTGRAAGLRDRIIREVLVRKVGAALSGDPRDLRRLTLLGRRRAANPGLRTFLDGLDRDIDSGSGLASLLARVGTLAGPRSRRRLVGNLIYNWGVVGDRIRRGLAAGGLWTPSLVVISPTMRCNLRCRGCYSGLYSREGELSEAEVDRLLSEVRALGCYFVVVSGGEPYIMKDAWLRLFRKHRDMFFLTYTNGTLLDRQTARSLGRLGNVAPGISVEGYREETDHRRGEGVHERVLAAMENLRREGVIFGISVTYTRENVPTVTQDRFVRYYLERGALFGWYFMFMPVGRDPILELVPTPEQRVYCGRRVAELRRKYPIFLADFWNDGPAAGGCLAAGRRYLHILSSGRVEPCVFAHFGVDSIREKSVIEAANSPFFRAIRREFPYNDTGNLKRPCMIIDNPQVLRKVVADHLAPQGHRHSEDLLHDPAVVAWVDRYAERFRELTEPEWQAMIEDPGNRWYRGGAEYRKLFEFRPDGPPEVCSGRPARRPEPSSRPVSAGERG